MKKLLFAVMISTCSVAWAEWEQLSISGDFEFSIYVDNAPRKKNGSIVKMWELRDFSSVQTNSSGDKFKSAKILYAYDCKEDAVAIISGTQYTGAVGSGKVIWSATFPEKALNWEPKIPGSLGEIKWKIACNR